jgi:hypothetical protein
MQIKLHGLAARCGAQALIQTLQLRSIVHVNFKENRFSKIAKFCGMYIIYVECALSVLSYALAEKYCI